MVVEQTPALDTFRPADIEVVVSELERAVDAAREERVADGVGRIAANGAQGVAAGAPEEVQWVLKTDQPDGLEAFEEADWQACGELILEVPPAPAPAWHAGLAAAVQQLGRERVRLAVPTLCRRWDQEALAVSIAKLRETGYLRWQIGNPAGWEQLGLRDGASELDVTADWPLYAMNLILTGW